MSYLAQIKQRLLVYSTLFEIHLRCIADFLDHPFKHCALSLHLVSAFIPTSMVKTELIGNMASSELLHHSDASHLLVQAREGWLLCFEITHHLLVRHACGVPDS